MCGELWGIGSRGMCGRRKGTIGAMGKGTRREKNGWEKRETKGEGDILMGKKEGETRGKVDYGTMGEGGGCKRE